MKHSHVITVPAVLRLLTLVSLPRHVGLERFLETKSASFGQCQHLTYRISGLYENCAGPSELADETFSRGHSRNDAARCYSFHNILCVPGDKVAIVDDILLSIEQLTALLAIAVISKELSSNLTSFRMIAPKLVSHKMPLPLILCTHKPSPLNMAFPRPCRL